MADKAESSGLVSKSSASTVSCFAQHSHRMQMFMCVLFFTSCFAFLFVLESKLTQQQKALEFAYKEFYLRPFHYKLDPFSYVELKNGAPITEPEPPNPHFMFSFEELLLNRFLDYYLWAQGPTDETDVTTDPDRLPLTIQAFGSHLRNRLYYQLERDELKINPILLTDPALPTDIRDPEDGIDPNKLLWNVIPYCNDPVLEDALHELGNINGFLYARGNHKNYRFLSRNESRDIASIIGAIPIKLAYLHNHNFINFQRYGMKSPIQISIVCDPIERKLRHFYTERYNYREWAEDFPISRTNWWRATLDECLDKNQRECNYDGVKNIKAKSVLDIGRTWLPRRVEWTIPQFCEYNRCGELGLEKDLEYVKDIVKQEYTVVGTLEKMSETLDHLEATVPQFFKGIKKIYYQKLAEVPKDVPGPEIPVISSARRAEMEKRYAKEIEFYRFASQKLEKDLKKSKSKSTQ